MFEHSFPIGFPFLRGESRFLVLELRGGAGAGPGGGGGGAGGGGLLGLRRRRQLGGETGENEI